MITIDKSDRLYKYLTQLGIENVEEIYTELARNGRYKRKDVKEYWNSIFQPSTVEDIDEKELELILDYFVDIKSTKIIKKSDLKPLLLEYNKTKSNKAKEEIINFELKNVLFMCLNYKSFHKDVNVQDLVQIANLGLLKALEKYTSEAKIDFEDYVLFWVRNAVTNEFKEKEND